MLSQQRGLPADISNIIMTFHGRAFQCPYMGRSDHRGLLSLDVESAKKVAC